jgi:hypothetical protein
MKYLLAILLFPLFTHSIQAMGLSDWQYITPNGTRIDDPGYGAHLSANHTHKELFNLTKWYFYKDYIIGTYRNDETDTYTTEYFILNELNGHIKTYSNKTLFEEDVLIQKLSPTLWTRWYKDHYKILTMIFLLMYVFWIIYLPIAICIIVIISSFIYACIVVKNMKQKIGIIIITATILLPFIFSILTDYWTQSI